MKRSVCAALAISIMVGFAATRLASVAAASEDPKPPAPTHKVQTTDLQLRFEQDGRVDSAKRVKVRPIPEAYSGSYDVVEIIKRSGRVTAGEVLVVFDPDSMTEQMRAANESLADAKRRLDAMRQETRVIEEASATTLERAGKAQAAAERTLHIWEINDGPRMLRTAEISIQLSQNRVDDQRQELEQLESMYKGTQLASETKDIVLERARRDLHVSETWLELTTGDSHITTQINQPQRDRDTRDDVRFATQANDHARINAEIAILRRQVEIDAAERAVRGAQERLDKLKKDEEAMTLTAPAAGLMTAIDLQPRDSVSARQVVCEVLDPSSLIVKFSVTAEDLRVLDGSTPLALSLPEYPEAVVKGTIQDLGEIGSASGEGAKAGTKFPMTVALQGAERPLRVGIRCTATATRTLKGVLAVPRKAVTTDKGQSTCTVRTAKGDERRTVTLGAGNDEMVQVVTGLAAGDEVVMPEPEVK